ncbi:hypothetical protein JAAARDRAFT_152872 [Jaapia argillacea MUCL 33604]|uniref:BIR-domain-containing protein n=1 Tax=Jaapia argillacea MUCL 33604 TaxID=933084 RepID=A0A067PZZ3_9AGAM|nr:hypothetical protein JAAARDRAFT_152872 [Jaapia argillacea MUCL 33604]
MESLQDRLDSFKTKRTKQSNKASSSKKWPHPSSYKANPRTLAEAGFYFNPSTDEPDSVSCFICSKELSDWAHDDDPFHIHWSKCYDSCPWAIVRCGLEHDVDEDGNFTFPDANRLPSNKTMETARWDTFRAHKSWPHDTVRGHGANSKKMAKAGFVYTPQSQDDDTATCLYCNISLSGWDADDDPLDEHRKRASKSGNPCPFFAPSPPSKTPLSRSTSKQRSRSRSKSIKPAIAQPPDSEEELAAAEAPTPAPLDSRATRGSVKARPPSSSTEIGAKTPASRRSTRSTVAMPSGGITGKTPKTRTTTPDPEPDSSGEAGPRKPKRNTSKRKRKAEVIAEEGDEAHPEKPRKSMASKTRSHTRQQSAVENPVEEPAEGANVVAEPLKESLTAKKRRDVEQAQAAVEIPEGTSDEDRPLAALEVPKLIAVGKEQDMRQSESAIDNEPSGVEAISQPVHPKFDGTTASKLVVKPSSRARSKKTANLSGSQADRKARAKAVVKVVEVSSDDDEDRRPTPLKVEDSGYVPSAGAMILADDPPQSHTPDTVDAGPVLPKDIDFPPDNSPPPNPTSPMSQLQFHAAGRETPVPETFVSFTSTLTHGPTTPVNHTPDIQTHPDTLMPLVIAPITTLTDGERSMTVEQWIRREILQQVEQLVRDGQGAIQMFQVRGAHVKSSIMAL